MKKIKLSEVEYLRDRTCEVFVDEKEIKFINGVALVKGMLYGINRENHKRYSVECYGLINEKFKEVYDDTTKGSRNLMFLSYNKLAVRIGENDFVVSVAKTDHDRSWYEYDHIRIIDNVPVIIKTFNFLSSTHTPSIFTDGHLLYDVEKAKVLTRYYPSIQPLPLVDVKNPTYFVTFKVTSYEYINGDERFYPINKDTGIVDFLSFTINSSDERISPIYSQLQHGYYDCSTDENFNQLVARRTLELKEIEKREIEALRNIKVNKFVLPPQSRV